MSFSDLVSGGAECGPSNPLASFSKRFGQDRGAQLDRFGEGGAESSGSGGHYAPSFRTQNGPATGSPAEVAFFQQGHQPQHAPFDLAPLQGALPLGPMMRPMEAPMQNTNFESSWQHLPHRQREQLLASFRGNQGPADMSFKSDSNWAREYSPGATASRSNDSQTLNPSHQNQRQQQHHQNVNLQPSILPYRLDPGMQGRSRLNMMGMRVSGPEMRSHSDVQSLGQLQEQDQSSEVDSTRWNSAFTAYDDERFAADAAPTEQKVQDKPATTYKDADELARTAGRLVSTVEHETNSKFKQSNFLNLMRKIRDKQAGIQGTDIVENAEENLSVTSPSESFNKGKGREVPINEQFKERIGRSPSSQREAVEWAGQQGLMASASGQQVRLAPGPDTYADEVEGRQMLNDMWAEEDARSAAIEKQAMERAFLGDGGDTEQRRREDAEEFAKYQRIMNPDFGSAADVIGQSSMEEDFDDASNQDFVGRSWEGRQGAGRMGVQGAEWNALQKDWDAWQATSDGLKHAEPPLSATSAPQYKFHAVNPYLHATTSATNGGSSISFPANMQSVLEREAAVQQDPNNASAWLDLGVKQQENEREGLAIAALHKAIQLDPTLRDAWLALAVSYTNENDRMAAFEAIERWIEATPEYSAVVKQHRSEVKEGSKATLGFAERHERLSNLLIALARHGSAQDRIDADVQVALGVLFNASEDYDKAVDCFSAALSVRPDDWLLYNRLGATLSNSGRSEEAMRFYHQALDLRPGFVRCHFNLSISCLNLKMYREAASHIYTALTLQSESADSGVQGSDESADAGGGVTSSSLWETLRVACELMDRPDLANLTSQRDLSRFDPLDFGLGGGVLEEAEEDLFSMPDNYLRRV